jgi:hypothetical protein
MSLTGHAFVALVRGIAGLMIMDEDVRPLDRSRGASVNEATFCAEV